MFRIRAAALAAVLAFTACDRGGGGGGGVRPVAEAGMDRTVAKGETVVLLGGMLPPVPAGAPSFAWTQVGGAEVSLSAIGGSASFVAPRTGGVLTFSLVVTVDGRASAPDTVRVLVVNGAPVASAGPDFSAGGSWWVTLDGRGSWDPDGDPLEFTWFQTAGPAVALVAGPPGTTRFVAPATPAVLRFEVVVSDGEASAADAVELRVVAAGANLPPTADAGPDVTAPRRGLVQLHGAGADPDALAPVTFRWEQTAGPAVSLQGASSAAPTFVAPAEACDLEFTLSVSDGVDVGTDVVRVLVRNGPPSVQVAIGPDPARTADDLRAEATAADPDGDAVTLAYAWTRNGAPLASETGAVLPAALTAKGDVLEVTVTASDGQASASATAAVTIQDSPPVLSAEAPATVPWGGTFAFAVSAVDPDGDPVDGALAVARGPAGMAVGAGGRVSWVATPPMFGPGLDVAWALALGGARLEGTVAVEDPARADPLYRTDLAIPGAGGLQAADLDGDGSVELLVSSAPALYELARAPGGAWVQRWAYPFQIDAEPASVTTFGAPGLVAAARDLDGDGRMEILAAAGDLVLLDGATRRPLARRADAGCAALELADLDGDGEVEVACLAAGSYYGDPAGLLVLDAATLAPRWEVTGAALGADLAIGNVDADPALEIVTSGGFVFDGATGANQWAYPAGFGARVDTGDLDGDGDEEIVGAGAWDYLRGYDAVLKTPLWERSVFDLDALLVLDLDGDGKAEVVTGDGQWGDVNAYRWDATQGALAAPFFTLDSQEHGVTAIAAGDLDGDGAPELAWGSGATSSGGNVLVVAGMSPAAVEWSSPDGAQLDGPFVGAQEALVAPGTREVVFLVPRTGSGYAGSRLVLLDPGTGGVRLSPQIGTNWGGAAALDVADVDGDGLDEAIVASADYYDGLVAVLDLATGAQTWRSPALSPDYSSVYAVALAHADLSGDGVPDPVALLSGGRIAAWNVREQTAIWTSTSLGTAADVAAADLDGDGEAELLALAGGALHAYRRAPAGQAGYVLAGSVAVAGTDLLVDDVDGDGAPDLFVLAGDGWSGAATLRRFDAALAPVGAGVPLDGVRAIHADAGPGPRRNVIAVTGPPDWTGGPATGVRAIDPVDGAVVWASTGLRGAVRPGSLSFLGGERPRIALGTATGMYVTR